MRPVCFTLQGYFLLLWDTPVSLIGLAYLLLLAALFVAPPLRGRFCERDGRRRWLGSPPGVARAILHRQTLHLREWMNSFSVAGFRFSTGALPPPPHTRRQCCSICM